MRDRAPFQPDDLCDLDELLFARADAVVAMREIHDGEGSFGVVGLRHDIDDHGFEAALQIARWEAERGYRATYFVLHTAPYWTDRRLRGSLEEIASLGHEIGIHANAVAEALRIGGDPAVILAAAVDTLRVWGFDVRGVAAHGDPGCYDDTGRLRFVNDEMFTECARPEMGDPDRIIRGQAVMVRLQPRPLAEFGLEYDTYRLPRALYLSDSGGRWSVPFDEMCDRFPTPDGQLHVLWHPDWWAEAFPAFDLAVT